MMEVIRQWQGLIIFAINSAFAFVLWLSSRTLPSKADIAKLHDLIEGQDRRIESLEEARKGGPTREDITSLRLEMERWRGELQAIQRETAAARDQFRTEIVSAREVFQAEIGGMRELIVRTERMVGVHTEHQFAQVRERHS